MRAIAFSEFGGPEVLRQQELPRPRAGRGEVLIRVVAAGVNPVDVMVRQGRLQNEFPHAFPLIPGWDAAGVVEEFGEGAGRFRKGDRVWSYTRKPLVQWGSYAEYVAVPESSVALMPSKLLYEEAAAVPVAGLTAFQSLFGHRAIGSGASVLVHAAAGSVGGIAVQLARNAGAKVIGTAGPENQDYIAALGAVAVDYTAEDFADAVGRHFPDGVDLVIDGVGGEVTARSLAVIRRGGRLVALVDPPDLDAAAQRNVIAQNLISEPNSEQLGLLARMYEQGTLRQPHLQKIYPLAEAAEAQRVVAEGHVRGKLVLNL